MRKVPPSDWLLTSIVFYGPRSPLHIDRKQASYLAAKGAIQRCAGYGFDSAKEGSATMATTKLSDEALLGFFQSHPELRDRMASIVGAVGNSEGNLVEADAAEERLLEEMRLFGREAMQSWASGRVEATERDVRLQTGMHRQGKKNSNGTRSSARSRS